MDVRLFGIIKLNSPLSHISQSISTNSYLEEQPIIQEDGTIQKVFCYSGNALRGQIRDSMAEYLLKKVGRKVSKDTFHLLFSGGKIGGDQVVDLEAAKIIRKNIPPLAILGGGIGNQIIGGKCKFQMNYPLCKEAVRVLPEILHKRASLTSYSDMVFEKSYTRTDDSKNDLNCDYFEGEQKKKNKGVPADQMRMTNELIAAGTELYSRIDLIDVNEIEIGALISGFSEVSTNPYIGGQSNKGHGYADFSYAYQSDNDLVEEFLQIKEGKLFLSPLSGSFMSKYDKHLDIIKTSNIADTPKEIKVMEEFWKL